MSIKRIFIVISAIFAASTVFADNSSVTSKKYVDDLMSGYQGKLPGSGANTLMIYDDEDGIGEKAIAATLGNSASAASVPTVGAVKTGLDGLQDTITGTAGYVMTGTETPGEVGERAIYGTAFYGDSLVTAETVNTSVTNAVNSSLIRVDANGDPSDSGTLWEINTDLFAIGVLPAGYTQLEWIESDGTQYIDTGYMPTSDVMEYGIEFYGGVNNNTSLFGAQRPGTPRYSGIPYATTSGTATSVYIGTSTGLATVTFLNSQWNTYILRTTSSTTGEVVLNSVETSFNYDNGILKVLPIYLFANNHSGTPIQHTANRVRSFYIQDNGILVRNLVPAKNSQNVVGMYDTVSGRFFTSPNGNNFNPGPAVGN